MRGRMLPKPSLSALVEKLRAGRTEWGAIWEQVLSAQSKGAIEDILAQPDDAYQFTAAQWAPIVFDFAAAYNKSGLDKDAVIDSMTPLYYGRTAGLVVESGDMDSATFERQVIRAQAQTFAALKPQLIERWDGTRSDA